MLLEFGAAPFGPTDTGDAPSEAFAEAVSWIPPTSDQS